jgi:transcriptional regulator with XRE-family HTH domain
MAGVPVCPACRSGPVRRGDSLCQLCVTAARTVPPSPTWVLDSPLLRCALADVNVPAVVAIVRAACGLSQQDMAGVAGWSRSALSCYERGIRDGAYDVRTPLQFADAVGMPRAALLALVLADPDATATGDQGDVMASLIPRAGSLHPSEFQLRFWRSCTDVLHKRDRQVGSTCLLRPAMLLWRQANQARARARATGADTLATIAGTALFVGHAAIDAGCLTQARPICEAARDLATSAHDPMLVIRALLLESQLWVEVARVGGSRESAWQALRKAHAAAEEARNQPVPQLHVLIAVRTAEAAPLLGDGTAFGAAISRARRELDRRPADSSGLVPAWLRHVGLAAVTAAEAAGALCLGQVARSCALYQNALEQADCPRDRAFAAASWAHALAVDGNRDKAVATALDIALPVLTGGVTSARCLQVLRVSPCALAPSGESWNCAGRSMT